MQAASVALPQTYPVGFTKWITVITAITCALLELIDATIVNVSLREISGSIGATTTEIAWVTTSYAISNVIIIPLTSMLSDWFGRRTYFTASVIIFTFASLMCGLSGSLWTLVFWRFVQGLGGGGLLSTAQTVILGAFPPQKAGIGNAIFGMGMIMGPTFGPALGGYITDNYSWHWIFFVNLPVGILAAFLSWTYITDRPGAVKPRKIDWWGIFFLVATIGSLQYVLEEGTAKDWFESGEIMLFTLISVAGLVAFIFRELSIDYPAVNIRLYQNYNLVIGSIMNLVLGMLLFSTVFIFPLFTQISLGWTATQTGMFFIPGALCTAIAMPLVGNMLTKGANPKTIIIAGVLMTSLFLWMLSSSSPDSTEWNFYFPFILRGFGLAFMMSPILSLAMQGLTGKDVAQAVGLANMIRQLGGAVGIALINVFLTNQNAQIKGNMLTYVTETSTAATDRIAMMTQNFIGAGYTPGDAEMLAYKMMDNAVLKQNFMVGYNLGYLMLACAVLASIPIVLLIRYKKSAKPTVVKDAH